MKKIKKMAVVLITIGVFSVGTVANAQTFTPCTGDIRYDSAAAESCATLAEQQGSSLGYTIDCVVRSGTETLSTGGIVPSYRGFCTINGYPGFAPEVLAGYTPTGGMNINSMWYTVPAILGSSSGGGNVSVSTTNTSTSGTSVTSVSGGTTSNVTSYLSNILNALNKIIERAQAQLYVITGGTMSSTGGISSGGTTLPPTTPPPSTPLPTTPPPTVPSGSLGNLRYIKINTSEKGWVSWREIEIYDTAGSKIPIVGSTVSATAYNSPTYSKDKAYDGNTSTDWNAGETTCPAQACPGAVRTAWIELDLGANKNVAKVRLLENGNTNSEVNEIYGKPDGGTYILLNTLAAAPGWFEDNQWLEYPWKTYANLPTVNLTVNGSDDITVEYGQVLVYKWAVTDADYLVSSEVIIDDSSLGGYTIAPATQAATLAKSDDQNLNPFKGYVTFKIKYYSDYDIPFSGMIAKAADFATIQKVYKVNLKAVQRNGGSAEKTITIRVKGHSTNEFDLAVNSIMNLRNLANPSSTATATLNGGSINLAMGGLYNYAWPSLSIGILPAGITANVTQPVGKSGLARTAPGAEFFQYSLTATANSGLAKGVYAVPVIGTDSQGKKAVAETIVLVGCIGEHSTGYFYGDNIICQ